MPRTHSVDLPCPGADDDLYMSLRLKRHCATGVMCAALVVALAACGGSHTEGHAGVQVVHVQERDFAIRAPHTLKAGVFDFLVTNHGPVSHELLLVRVPKTGLPMRADGITIDEDALGRNLVGNLDPAAPGTLRHLRARLGRGQYVLLCNMSGHYMSGMSSPLRVV
jgi:uncharacterized cupredoxin-like copper-binding protein